MDYEIMHEAEARKYRGFNPEFVRKVWEKRKETAQPVRKQPVNGRKMWTDEDKTKVADMMRRGLTSGQIGRHFGKTNCAIRGLIRYTPELQKIDRERKGVK